MKPPIDDVTTCEHVQVLATARKAQCRLFPAPVALSNSSPSRPTSSAGISNGSPDLTFALPDVGEEELQAVCSAIRSGWISSGPRVLEFEDAFANYIGPGVHAVSVNSGTAGLHLAAEACGIGPGDEVLVPVWTFTATAEVIRYLGAQVVLVDVEPGSLNIDLNDASRKVTERTRAVMPVHFAGLPTPFDRVHAFAETHSLEVIEDAAHAFPARWKQRLVGSSESAATVFSFYATKTITTGEGGMLVTKRADIAARARCMRLHGIDRDVYSRYRSLVLPGNTESSHLDTNITWRIPLQPWELFSCGEPMRCVGGGLRSRTNTIKHSLVPP